MIFGKYDKLDYGLFLPGESGQRAALSFRSVFALNRHQSRVWVCHSAPSLSRASSYGNSNGNSKGNGQLYNVTLYTHHISSGKASLKFLKLIKERSLRVEMDEQHFLFYSVLVGVVCFDGHLAWWTEQNKK